MIYLHRRNVLSRQLSGYVRASTDNPTGWRPQYTRLGSELGSVNRMLPDWKTAAAARDRSARLHSAIAAGRQRVAMAQASRIDAHARGDMSGGLGSLGINPIADLTAQMVRGAQYVFHFSGAFTLAGNALPGIAKKISADTNFLNPVASQESGGIQVNFTYNGVQSTIAQAAAEMQNVLGTWDPLNPFGIGARFYAAEGGPAISVAGKTVYTISPDGGTIQYTDGTVQDVATGIVYDSSGNVVSSPGSTQATQPPPGGGSQGFSWSTLFAGAGGGVALTIGAGVLLLILANR